MGLLSILTKGLNAMIDEALTPESFKMGEKFENYVRQFLFVNNYYDLLERSHNYTTNSKDYVQSSLKPDFKFCDKWTKKEFYVESKFRTSDYKGKIVWCNDNQLIRYKEYNKERPVFLMLGMGGDPKYPEFLSLIPLAEAKYTGLFTSLVEKFEIKIDEPIKSKILWGR
jgi:hypothetical protein